VVRTGVTRYLPALSILKEGEYESIQECSDIAAAARKLLNGDRGLSMLAERLLLQHDPKFRVNHEYTQSMPVDSTGLTVDSSTKLGRSDFR
jgi:hypothetical protein